MRGGKRLWHEICYACVRVRSRAFKTINNKAYKPRAELRIGKQQAWLSYSNLAVSGPTPSLASLLRVPSLELSNVKAL